LFDVGVARRLQRVVPYEVTDMSRAFRIVTCSAAAALMLIVGGCSAHRRPVEAVANAHSGVRSPEGTRDTRERDLAQLRRELTAVQSRTSDRGVVLTIPDVLFEVDKADLKASAQRDLVSITAFLKAYPDQKMLIESHPSSGNVTSHDQELSLRRVTVVETFFLRKGVDPARLEVRGVGENQPIASTATESGRQQNRRVDIVML
jgi:outer membrane protein OmpA-like peptidoglycan-associated protein